jgi:hypothetical protein
MPAAYPFPAFPAILTQLTRLGYQNSSPAGNQPFTLFIRAPNFSSFSSILWYPLSI